MKSFCKHSLAALAVSAALFTLPSAAASLQDESYSVGATFGNYLSGQIAGQVSLGQEIDLEALMNGVEDALNGKTKFDAEQMLDHINDRAERLNTALTEKQAAERAAVKAANEAFLAENAAKPGVKVTESGLQYEVLVEGQGDKPQPQDVATVHFKGWTMDGTQFENTYTNNEPTQVSLIHTIPGWEEGVQLMSPGAKYRFVVPADLAYDMDTIAREAMNGGNPAPSALTFEIELLSFTEPKAGNFGHGASMGGGMSMDQALQNKAH